MTTIETTRFLLRFMKFGNGEAWQEACMVGEINERGGDGEDKSRHISKAKQLVFLQCCVHVPSFKGQIFFCFWCCLNQ